MKRCGSLVIESACGGWSEFESFLSFQSNRVYGQNFIWGSAIASVEHPSNFWYLHFVWGWALVWLQKLWGTEKWPPKMHPIEIPRELEYSGCRVFVRPGGMGGHLPICVLGIVWCHHFRTPTGAGRGDGDCRGHDGPRRPHSPGDGNVRLHRQACAGAEAEMPRRNLDSSDHDNPSAHFLHICESTTHLWDKEGTLEISHTFRWIGWLRGVEAVPPLMPTQWFNINTCVMERGSRRGEKTHESCTDESSWADPATKSQISIPCLREERQEVLNQWTQQKPTDIVASHSWGGGKY